ncbi:MAG: hypothetical protein CGW95_06545 [Phenylobacterium zucineum]|nr:MAG: hypothetical protein CGW95_06545 [Phenylobacterium zucineum]
MNRAQAIINIGLAHEELTYLVEQCEKHELHVLEFWTKGRTFAALVESHRDTLRMCVYALCKDLNRDAIAMMPVPAGEIVGPRSDRYGAFDFAQFQAVPV